MADLQRSCPACGAEKVIWSDLAAGTYGCPDCGATLRLSWRILARSGTRYPVLTVAGVDDG